MDITPEPPMVTPGADPSHPDWVPPDGNLIEVPDMSDVVPDGPPEDGDG